MILTVASTSTDAASQWRAELLEFSWRRVDQTGELVRLISSNPGAELPEHRQAHTVRTLPWNPHPYTRDPFAGYDLPASLLEWLYRRPVDATVLLVDSHSVFRAPVNDEVEAGQVIATPWDEHPTTLPFEAGDASPFGLGKEFAYLAQVAVNRSLEPARVTWPLLAQGRDLLKIAARWLELTALIRQECEGLHGRSDVAHRIAYTIAAAEYGLVHETRPLGVTTDVDDGEAPIYDYRTPIETPRGEILWDPETWEPWTRVQPEEAKPGPGRDLLTLLEEKITLDEAGGDLAFLLPKRCDGVREARLLDQMLLDIPGQKDSLSLNASASAIWELCDDLRTVADISSELEREYGMDRGALRGDVEQTLESLRDAGALRLEQVSR